MQADYPRDSQLFRKEKFILAEKTLMGQKSAVRR